jgi:hypothetical protein
LEVLTASSTPSGATTSAWLAQAAATRELAEKAGLPRLVWVEGEYEMVLREAELGYVRRLIADIESGALDGLDW